MYQAETPVGLCKYKDNEKGELVCLLFKIYIFKHNHVSLVSYTNIHRSNIIGDTRLTFCEFVL